LKALREVLGQRKARLIIFGEGLERANLEGLARSLEIEKYVSFPSFVQNLPAHMARANLFVLSSRWEGLPTVLIEALVVGTPVVSTNCPSGPRGILEEGRWGKLAPVGDVGALAQAIVEQLEDRIFASEEAWRRFALEEVLKKWFALIEDSRVP
jgi:glycosyltransferase involved in cell wall biosynthesis